MKNTATDQLVKILWDYNKLNQKLEKADVIIGLGSHDTRVAQRSAELFLSNYALLLLFSGGFGRLSDKNWTKPEAEVFAKIAMKLGVPKEKIIIENKSTNTGENLSFSMKVLKEKGIVINNVIFVHKEYMERRQYATWQKLFPDIKAVITSPQMSYEDYRNRSRVTKEEMINIVVGETQRIKLYPQKGFMIPQEIPDAVWQAFEELAKRGYTSQLVEE
jgi:uncharacterized SAM-binding protein YcdF (DUF218 family)